MLAAPLDSAHMTISADLSLRDATPGDLPAIAQLRDDVGWATHEWALRAVIGQPHARCVVAVDGADTIVAVGSGIAYGALGFVGNMIVAEAYRRRGLGSTVLATITDFLEAAGCRRLELNATSEGRPLYERHGFATIGISATARIGRDIGLAAGARVELRQAWAGDLDALAAYDVTRFGGDRRPLLALLLADPVASLLVAEDNGALVGYACLRTDTPRIGPFVADIPTVAESLLWRAFALLPQADELRLNLPPNNRPGAEWLRELGVEVEPWDGRMGRGPQISRRDDTIYGMAVGALG